MMKPNRIDLEGIKAELDQMAKYIADLPEKDLTAECLYGNLVEAGDFVQYALDLQIDDFENRDNLIKEM